MNCVSKKIWVVLLISVFTVSVEAASPKLIYAVLKPSYDAELSFPVSGTISKLLIKDGNRVKKGQLMAQLENSVELARLEQLKVKAESEIEENAVKAELKQLKAQAESTLEEDAVKAEVSQLKAKSDSTIEVDASIAKMKQAESDYEKVEKASKSGAASSKELEHSALDVKIGKLSVKLAEFEHLQNKRKYERGAIAVKRAEFERKQNLLKYDRGAIALKLAEFEREQYKKRYEEMKKEVARMSLHSEVDGIVENVSVEKGETVTIQNNMVARVVVIDPLWIDAPVHVSIVKGLKLGDSASINVLEQKIKLTGKVINISPLADTATNTVRVRISVSNPDEQKAGQQVQVSFP